MNATPGSGECATLHVRALTIRGPAGLVDARLYEPGPRSPAETLLVFFHGGGFVSGSLDASDACLREMATRTGTTLLAPTYAQAPDQPFPAAAEDAYAAIVDCAAHPRRYRWTGRSLVVGGIEAGGNLAAVAALMARDRGGPRFAGQILMVPMLDPGLTSSSMRCATADGSGRIASDCAAGYRGYLPRPRDRDHPYACPLASTRLKGLPPTLVLSIDGDPLRDEADAYVAKLAAAGVPVQNHVMPASAGPRCAVDAAARCRASADATTFAVLAAFIASAS